MDLDIIFKSLVRLLQDRQLIIITAVLSALYIFDLPRVMWAFFTQLAIISFLVGVASFFEETNTMIKNAGASLGNWAIGRLEERLRKDDDGAKLVKYARETAITLHGKAHGLIRWKRDTDELTARIDGDRITIPYLIGHNRYEIVLPYNAAKARNVTSISVTVDGVTTSYPKHNGGIPFYLKDILPPGAEIEYE